MLGVVSGEGGVGPHSLEQRMFLLRMRCAALPSGLAGMSARAACAQMTRESAVLEPCWGSVEVIYTKSELC